LPNTNSSNTTGDGDGVAKTAVNLLYSGLPLAFTLETSYFLSIKNVSRYDPTWTPDYSWENCSAYWANVTTFNETYYFANVGQAIIDVFLELNQSHPSSILPNTWF